MKSTLLGSLILAVLMCPSATFGQQFLMIPDSSADSIGLYSPVDGSLVDANFILDAANDATYNFSTPKEALQVGSEIWVSDQIADAIFIFDLAGNYISKIGEDAVGDPTGAFDNNRGIGYSNGTVYVANSGSNNGAPGDAIVTVDAASKMVTGSFVVGDPAAGSISDPFDVEAYQGNLLVTDINVGTDGEGVDLVAEDGTYLSKLVSSDGVDTVDFAQQVSAKSSDSNFLVAGFSPPDGLYEYDSTGMLVDFFEDTAGRGVYELQNGNYLYTNGGGTFVLDTATGVSTNVGAGSQFISLLTVPEPSSFGLVLVLGIAIFLRRR